MGGGKRNCCSSPTSWIERGKAVVADFAGRGVPVEQVTETVMNAISETETPQGIMVVLSLLKLPIPDRS